MFGLQSRAIVIGDVYDAFLRRLVEATKSLKIGPAEDPATSVGPVIDEESFAPHRALYRNWPGRRTAGAGDATGAARRAGLVHRPAYFCRRAADGPHRPRGNLWPGAGGDSGQRLDRSAARSPMAPTTPSPAASYSRSPAALDRARRELLVGNLYLNRPITGAWSIGSRSAASRCRASAARPAAATICCNS